MSRSRPPRRRQPRASRRPTFHLRPEPLEDRRLLAVSSIGVDEVPPAAVTAPSASVLADVVWNGKHTVAYRDTYVVQMPTTQVADSRGHVSYVSSAPDVVSGWSVREAGLGFYALVTPGASVDEVQAWASTAGVVSVEPNTVLVKQAVQTANDPFFSSYLWGLNNTGQQIDPQTGLTIPSRESIVAGPDIVNGTIRVRNLNNPEGNNVYPRVRDADIDAPEAWYLQTGSRDVIVAVFDDGIDNSNPDLNANMWNRDKANVALAAAGLPQIPAYAPVASPGFSPAGVGRHGFNSAMIAVDPLFYEGSPKYPTATYPTFSSTRPGDPALIQRLTDGSGKQYVSWPGANDSHGTHVAGIIGAGGNNGTGVTGVSWAVSLYSANIFRYGDYDSNGLWVAADQSGSVLAFVDAVTRVLNLKNNFNQNFVVANLSFNTYNGGASAAMAGAIAAMNAADMLVVVAAGNGYDPEFRDGVGDAIATEIYPLNDCPTYPASYRVPNMIVVTSSGADDRLPRFANWGPNVDIAAPGVNIMSTVPISARANNPGSSLLFPSQNPTDIPVQYDSHEPIGLFAPPEPDPASPPPPGSWGDGSNTRSYRAQPNISRPYNYREYVNPLYPSVGNPYAVMSGTSMSAAYVSGAAALMAAEFYRWTGAMPTGAYLKQGILSQADSVSTLTYTEGSNFPSQDYSFLAFNSTGGVQNVTPIARTGMYETTTDPEPRTHSIPGNLRLNVGKCVYWVRDNLPPSVAIGPRPETDDDIGESRLEGDAGLTPFFYALSYVNGTGVFAGVAPTGTITLQAWTQDSGLGPNFATGGVDYVVIPRAAPVTMTVLLGPGVTFPVTLPFQVNVVGDTLPENDESFSLGFRVLPNTLNIWSKTRLLGETIIDDDPTNAKPAVTVTTPAVTIAEGNGGTLAPTRGFVTFGLDRPALRPLLVPYFTAQLRNALNPNGVAREGVDYVGASQTATIAAGQTSVSVPVFAIGDTFLDRNSDASPVADEKFRIVLGRPNLGVKKRGGVRSEITIRDDDTAVPPPTPSALSASITPTSADPVLEGGTASFTVQLRDGFLPFAVPAGRRVTVFYTLVGGPATDTTAPATLGSDFRGPASGSIVIPAGASSGTINVATLPDRLIEGDETFTVQIARAVMSVVGSTTTQTLSLGTPVAAQARIRDVPAVTIIGPASLIAAGGTATFTVGTVDSKGATYAVPAGYRVRVDYAVVNGTAKVGTDFSGPTTGSVFIDSPSAFGFINVSTINRISAVEKSFSVRITGVTLVPTGPGVSQALVILGTPSAKATIART